MPSYGDNESVTFGQMEGQNGASAPSGARKGLIPEDRSGVRLPEPGEGLEVQDDPSYQNQVVLSERAEMEAAPPATGAPRDGLNDVMRPLLVDAINRIAPDEGLTYSLTIMPAQLPDGSQRNLPTLLVETPSPVLGYVLSHGLQFMQMSQWTQAAMDEVVRNVVEVVREQRARALAGLNGQAPSPAGGSGLIVPGR